jgi:hypothetical protein
VAGGAFEGSDPGPTTVIVRETASTPTETTQTETTPTETDPPDGDTAPYTAGTYAFDYPAGWTVVDDDVDKGAYTETRLQSPDGGATVLVDRTPGAPLDPAEAASEVEAQTAETDGYERVTFEPIDVGPREGFAWEFSLPSGPRVDYFTTVDGVSFAVLGHGSDYETAKAVAHSVAGSLR